MHCNNYELDCAVHILALCYMWYDLRVRLIIQTHDPERSTSHRSYACIRCKKVCLECKSVI